MTESIWKSLDSNHNQCESSENHLPTLNCKFLKKPSISNPVRTKLLFMPGKMFCSFLMADLHDREIKVLLKLLTMCISIHKDT